MITRLEATRYRCFDRLNVDFQSFEVLVGANGSGKTTLLDVPVLLGDLCQQRSIGAAFTQRRSGSEPRAKSLRELVHKEIGDWFILALEAELPVHVQRTLLESSSPAVQQEEGRWPTHLRYELRLQIFNEFQLHVQNEYLFTFARRIHPERDAGEAVGAVRLHGEVARRRDWNFIIRREYGGETTYRIETRPRARPQTSSVGPDQLALPRVPFESGNEYPAARWLYDFLVEGAVFFSPSWDVLRSASPPGLPPTLQPDGRNLPWLAYELHRQEPDRYAAWIRLVRAALPQITDVRVRVREEDQHSYFDVLYNKTTVSPPPDFQMGHCASSR